MSKKGNKDMENRYHKLINLSGLKNGELERLDIILNKLGYVANKDYRINYFSTTCEMIVTNKECHKDMKIIRRTSYNKNK